MGTVVAARALAFGPAGDAVVLDVGVARIEPAFDVLDSAHESPSRFLELVRLVVDVVPVGCDLACERILDAVEVVGARGHQILDRGPVRTPGIR